MNAAVCPTITAYDTAMYREQMQRVKPFAKRIHIDLMDGEFTPNTSVNIDDAWWPHELVADIHVMYKSPMDYLDKFIKLKPHMVIVHMESEIHHMRFVAELHKEGIKAGLAILQDTPVENAEQIMHSFDQVLVFSGNLGYHGGSANLSLLNKVRYIKAHHGSCEIAWDGGINDANAEQLVKEGVDVLNAGGFIHDSHDPKLAYDTLLNIMERVRGK